MNGLDASLTIVKLDSFTFKFSYSFGLVFEVSFEDWDQAPRVLLGSFFCHDYCRPRYCARCGESVKETSPKFVMGLDGGRFEEWFDVNLNPLASPLFYSATQDRIKDLHTYLLSTPIHNRSGLLRKKAASLSGPLLDVDFAPAQA